MQGFQYTNNTLDFFPHSEGYAKSLPAVLGGGSSYQFKYVFTYTDHLGNIRLKYAQDPSNNNRISILEEDHYYPYGLKHSGYNSFHQIFATEDGDGPGTGIVLTPVNPFLGDSHKYKFGGKEYQDEFDVNMYDFGARNYDPALGRWMNVDPLAEMMRRHSPYNYAFNNPVFFIDPDGMIPATFSDGYVTHDLSTSSGAVDVSSFVVTSFDGGGNTLDSQIVTDLSDVNVVREGGKISSKKEFNKQVDTAFGDKADKPAERSQENVDKTINKVGTLSDMRGSFKEDVKVGYAKNPSSPKTGLTVASGEKWNKVENVYIYDAAFVSYRTLAQTLFHEFVHVLDFQSLNYYNTFCGFDGNYSAGTAKEIAEAISEVRAYRMGQQITGSSLKNNGYNAALETLKKNNVDYKF